jgi:hypothetical protein
VSDDAKPVLSKSKATAAVAKKVGVSTRTFERGKKILEKASEEEKQKLREGKASIAQVYREVVALEREPDSTREGDKTASVAAELLVDDVRAEQNKVALVALLEKLLEKEVFCPSCGHAMFECSKCHKTLQKLLRKSKEADAS